MEEYIILLALKKHLLLTFALVVLSIEVYSQTTTVDSLLSYIKNSPNDTNKVNAYNELAFRLRVANPDSAIHISLLSEKLAIELEYENGIASALMRRGIANTSIGNYYVALQLLLDANERFQKTGMKTGIASCLNNIGRIYNFLQDYDKALDYYKESVKLFGEINDYQRKGNILNNVGYIHKLRLEYDSALFYLELSLQQARELKDSRSMFYPMYNIGGSYLGMGELDSAQTYLNEALLLARDFRNQYIISLSLIDLGTLHVKKNELSLAKVRFQEAYDVASRTGLIVEKAEAAKNLSALYEDLGDAEMALALIKEYKAIDDSLFNSENTRKLTLLEAESKYRQEQMESKIRHEQIKMERQKELGKVILIRNTFIIGFVFMLVIAFMFYRNFQRKRAANDLLRELNKQIKEQAELLKKSNKEIQEINNSLEAKVTERTRKLQIEREKLQQYIHSNSHVVRAPLARILALVELYKSNDDENVDVPYITKNVHKSAQDLDKVLREINDLLNQE